MLEQLQKEKKKDSTLFLCIFITLLFAVFALTYYFWQKEQRNNDSSTNEVVTTQSEPQPIAVAPSSRPSPTPTTSTQRRLPARSAPQQALLKCTDPRTGTVSLAKTCPPGFTAEKIETQDHAGIRPSRYRRTPSTNQTQQGQITVIRDYRQEVKKCDDFYDPFIKDIMDIPGYLMNEFLRKKLDRLRERKAQCVDAANRGKAKFY